MCFLQFFPLYLPTYPQTCMLQYFFSTILEFHAELKIQIEKLFFCTLHAKKLRKMHANKYTHTPVKFHCGFMRIWLKSFSFFSASFCYCTHHANMKILRVNFRINIRAHTQEFSFKRKNDALFFNRMRMRNKYQPQMLF